MTRVFDGWIWISVALGCINMAPGIAGGAWIPHMKKRNGPLSRSRIFVGYVIIALMFAYYFTFLKLSMLCLRRGYAPNQDDPYVNAYIIGELLGFAIMLYLATGSPKSKVA